MDKIIHEIKFRVIEFLYRHKLFKVDKKCWANLVAYCYNSGKYRDVPRANKCGYCGSCMTKERYAK